MVLGLLILEKICANMLNKIKVYFEFDAIGIYSNLQECNCPHFAVKLKYSPTYMYTHMHTFYVVMFWERHSPIALAINYHPNLSYCTVK